MMEKAGAWRRDDAALSRGCLHARAQVNTTAKVMTLTWQVTADTLAAGAASGGRGATTEVFAPVQGFFTVPSVEQLSIQVGACSESVSYGLSACMHPASAEGSARATCACAACNSAGLHLPAAGAVARLGVHL